MCANTMRFSGGCRELTRSIILPRLAAAVGVGQSVYEVEQHGSINDIGTAVLLETLIKRPVERL